MSAPVYICSSEHLPNVDVDPRAAFEVLAELRPLGRRFGAVGG